MQSKKKAIFNNFPIQGSPNVMIEDLSYQNMDYDYLGEKSSSRTLLFVLKRAKNATFYGRAKHGVLNKHGYLNSKRHVRVFKACLARAILSKRTERAQVLL